MSGGTDVIIPVRDVESALDLAIRAALRLWKRPVIEDADTGEVIENYRDLVLGGRTEILIYRDAKARADWERLGADQSLDGTMIHLVARNGELTIGVDDVPDSLIRLYINAVRTRLWTDLFASSASSTKEAA